MNLSLDIRRISPAFAISILFSMDGTDLGAQPLENELIRDIGECPWWKQWRVDTGSYNGLMCSTAPAR